MGFPYTVYMPYIHRITVYTVYKGILIYSELIHKGVILQLLKSCVRMTQYCDERLESYADSKAFRRERDYRTTKDANSRAQ